MSDEQTINPGDVGPAKGILGRVIDAVRGEPHNAARLGRRKPKPRPFARRIVQKTAQRTVLPLDLIVHWSTYVAEGNDIHEAVATSATLMTQSPQGIPGGALVELRRGPGDLARLPVADLVAAAKELAECEDMDDVLDVFLGIVTEGVR